MGSVSQIGWEWYSRLAARVPVTLFTHVRNREALVKAGAPLPGSEAVFVDTEWFAGPLYRTASKIFPRSEHAVFLVSSLDFFVYDRGVMKEARKRAGIPWDVVHLPTPVTTAAPTVLHRLGRPVVRGPLNSGLGSPPGFLDVMKEETGWLYPVRHLTRLLDAAIGSTRNSRAILTATRSTVESIAPRHRFRCVSMLENGVELTRFSAAPWPAGPSPTEPLRVVFVGRMIPFKGIPYLLDAVGRVKGEFPIEVRLVGDGPVREECRKLSAEKGLDGIVTFLGNRPLDEVADQMRWAHVFCLPSIRESGGAVLLEAMACARPVTAVAFGGPAEIVDDEVGRPISPDGPEAVVSGLVEAFRDVVRNPGDWRKRGETGRRRAEERYGWDAKVDAAVELFRKFAAEKGAGR
jgi:glycosyltransferase involved in cell wall biosynthesis